MARKSSNMEEWIENFAKLPWWVNIILAIVAFFILHYFAALLAPENTSDTQQIGSQMARSIWQSLAIFGQYLLPLLLILAGGISFIKQKQRQALLHRSEHTENFAAEIRSMSWREFEMLVGEMFRQQGYRVSETADGADGGIDLILYRGREKSFVQCKHWKAQKVSVHVVRELYGVMTAQGASAGFVITSGRFTADAQKYVQGLNIALIDGDILARWIQKNRHVVPRKDPLVQPLPNHSPHCPQCGTAMVKRIARQGKHAGKEFWGCSTFPRCRGTLPVKD